MVIFNSYVKLPEGNHSTDESAAQDQQHRRQELPRQLLLDMGHPIYDDEVQNISQLNGVAAGTLVPWLQQLQYMVNHGLIVVKCWLNSG